MIILGIETSCDETALALIETRPAKKGVSMPECRVIQSLVHSQAELHSAYGGVYPSLAKREHGKNIVPLLEKILRDLPNRKTDKCALTLDEVMTSYPKLLGQNPDLYESVLHAKFLTEKPCIDMIAVTEGPGLEPALWVGIIFAEILSKLWNIPLVPINHMEGHVIGSLLRSDEAYGTWQHLHELPLPSIALLISGGHTELVRIIQKKESAQKEFGFSYAIIGETKDDAVGEAFDKAARLLGLPYPGGPHVSKLAFEAREKNIVSTIKLPRPMINSGDLNFSFSGLKTAVLYAVREAKKALNDGGDNAELPYEFNASLAREFEDAVTETLDTKLRQALEFGGHSVDSNSSGKTARSIIIGGGVSANHVLRAKFEQTAKEYDIPIFLPSRHVSGDNALMIALAAAVDHGDGSNASKKLHSRPLKAHGTKRL